jgi:hypothetical protein
VNPGTLTVYRWELRKLRAQKRTYLGLALAALVPLIFVVALVTQGGQPEEVAFGRYVNETGLAIPLVLLLFGSVWMFPLITALVAGDIVAAEDRHDTLKGILTRSVERHQIYVGKVLAAFTYAILAIAITGAVALGAGILASGFNSITSLSGTQISAGKGLGLVVASLLVYLVPILAIASIGLFRVPQQRRGDRRHADVLAARPADRDPARPRRDRALPAEHPVRRLAGLPAHAGRLGPGHPGALGLCALRGAGAVRRRARLPAPRRRWGLRPARCPTRC